MAMVVAMAMVSLAILGVAMVEWRWRWRRRMELIQTSWAKVEALGIESVALLFFKRTFEIAPEALKLFSFRDEANVRARVTAPM
jgi:hypothetical protein